MSTVNAEFRFSPQTNTYFTNNPTKVLADGEPILNTTTRTIYVGDGSTQIQNLQPWGAAAWGSITGTLSNQTDLQNALNAKANTTSPTFLTSLNADYSTASTIAIFDSSKNLISAATATYPSLTELSYSKGVTSAIQTQLNSKVAIICENMPMAAMNASTTYYWSNLFTTNASGPRTTVGQSLVSLPFSGTIIGASITCLTFNAGVSTNAMTISMRINGVDNQISNTAAFSSSASSPQQYNITGLNISYTAGQAYEIKCVTPAWSSAPSLAIIRVALHIRY